ncbi:MAG TPA: MerR family transcriptional regulator [bacterium]|nr:MerR family transcriptional regulator [bacterium]
MGSPQTDLRRRRRAAERGADPGAALLPIGALARQAGISTRTLRYYEEIGLLQAARRFAGGRRVYDGEALERLRFIARLKGLGISLQEVRHLNEVFALHHSTARMLQELEGLLTRRLGQLDGRLKELLALRGDLQAYRQRIRTRLHWTAPKNRKAVTANQVRPVRGLAQV